jgi:DNA-binding IclR family transcriptional regulator
MSPDPRVTPAALELEYPNILELGYAKAIQEESLLIMGFAAPIWNSEGKLTACLSLWTQADEFSKAEIQDKSQEVIKSANVISQELGWPAEHADQN